MQEGRLPMRELEEARVAENAKWIALYDAQYARWKALPECAATHTDSSGNRGTYAAVMMYRSGLPAHQDKPVVKRVRQTGMTGQEACPTMAPPLQALLANLIDYAGLYACLPAWCAGALPRLPRLARRVDFEPPGAAAGEAAGGVCRILAHHGFWWTTAGPCRGGWKRSTKLRELSLPTCCGHRESVIPTSSTLAVDAEAIPNGEIADFLCDAAARVCLSRQTPDCTIRCAGCALT